MKEGTRFKGGQNEQPTTPRPESPPAAQGQRKLGVSVDFFVASIKTLSKIHGPRMTGKFMEDFRAGLAEAEFWYQQLPPDEGKKKRKPTTTGADERAGA